MNQELRSGHAQPTRSVSLSSDTRSRPANPRLEDGLYVYAQDEQGIVFVLPDGPHLHPKILGGVLPAMYAGDMTVRKGHVVDLTNLSGTFLCDDRDGLRAVADALRKQGLIIEPMAVRFFPQDGTQPVVLV